MVVNEDQAKVVEQIYGLFISGLSPVAIAKRLTESGVPSPTGKEKWYEGTVRSILKNEKYKGCALLQKTYTPDFLTKKAVANDGTVPQYYVEDSHPAIIVPEQFALVQISSLSGPATPSTPGDHLLREDPLRVLRRLVWLEGLAQQRQIPPGDLVVQSQVQRQNTLQDTAPDRG